MSYLNDSLCNFNFYEKAVPFPFSDIIMVELLCFSSVFFSQKGVIFFFSLTYFLNKIGKSKDKTSFKEMVKGYICYIFLI